MLDFLDSSLEILTYTPRSRFRSCSSCPCSLTHSLALSLSLFTSPRLQQNPLVSKVSCYDIRGAPGVAADLSHINTPSEAIGFGAENDGLAQALKGAEIVVIPAGVPRKPGMTRDDVSA